MLFEGRAPLQLLIDENCFLFTLIIGKVLIF